MMYNEISNFPSSVDELIFFHDVSLDDLDFIRLYDSLIGNKKYTEASELLDAHSSHIAYSAGLYNLMENRIYALQDYLLEKGKDVPPKKPETLSKAEPTNVYMDMIWVS